MKGKLFLLSEILSLLLIPALLAVCAVFKLNNAAFIATASAVLALTPFFLKFEASALRPRDIMPPVVLAAVAAVGRIAFAALPNFKPVTAVVIIAGACFGKQSGFMTGALAALGSNLFFGQGAWTPWQMYAWGIIGFVAGALCEKGVFGFFPAVCVYGAVSSVVFGVIMDTYTLCYLNPQSFSAAVAVYAAGAVPTAVHLASTVVFLLLGYKVWLKKLSRIKLKYGID